MTLLTAASAPRGLARPLHVQARQWLGAALVVWGLVVPAAWMARDMLASEAAARVQAAQEIREAARRARAEAARLSQLLPAWQTRVQAAISAVPDQLRLRALTGQLAERAGLKNLVIDFYPMAPDTTQIQLSAEGVLDRQMLAFLAGLRAAQRDRLLTREISLKRTAPIAPLPESVPPGTYIRLSAEFEAYRLPGIAE